jgi:hypothetical protein
MFLLGREFCCVLVGHHSRNQQSKQNQKQPRATQGHPNITDGNPHNQNYKDATAIGGKNAALQ